MILGEDERMIRWRFGRGERKIPRKLGGEEGRGGYVHQGHEMSMRRNIWPTSTSIWWMNLFKSRPYKAFVENSPSILKKMETNSILRTFALRIFLFDLPNRSNPRLTTPSRSLSFLKLNSKLIFANISILRFSKATDSKNSKRRLPFFEIELLLSS